MQHAIFFTNKYLGVINIGSLLSYFRDKDLTTSTGYVYSDWFTRGRHGSCKYRDYKSNFTAMTFLPSSLCTQSHPVVVVDQPGTRWVLGAWVSEVCVSGNGWGAYVILLGWPLVVLAALVAAALAIVLPCLHPSLPHSSTSLSGVVSLCFFAQLSFYAPTRGVSRRVDRDELIYLSCRSLSRLKPGYG